jgi:midasin
MARKSSAALEGKRGYLTLRDLFRWADRCSLADQPTQFYDWERHFAEEGFLVLASKVRIDSEAETVQKCLEKIFKRSINPEELYELSEQNKSVTRNDVLAILKAATDEDIVWTRSAIRMAVITLHSLRFKEPVLLVGETGCGKTQICQTLARVLSRALVSINCHLNTESSDFLGGLRPNRSISEDDEALFQWVDGPLVQVLIFDYKFYQIYFSTSEIKNL